MRKSYIVSALVFALIIFAAGSAFADTTTTHINIYNDTDEPFSWHVDGDGDSWSGTLQPGQNTYIKDHPTAYYLKKTGRGYTVDLKYKFGEGARVVCAMENWVNEVGTAQVTEFKFANEECTVHFWQPEYTTKHDDNQVNFYLHIRNKE